LPQRSNQDHYKKLPFQQSQGSLCPRLPPKPVRYRKHHQRLLPNQVSLNHPLQRELKPLFRAPYLNHQLLAGKQRYRKHLHQPDQQIQAHCLKRLRPLDPLCQAHCLKRLRRQGTRKQSLYQRPLQQKKRQKKTRWLCRAWTTISPTAVPNSFLKTTNENNARISFSKPKL
jgi:hypothetical protein